MPRITEWKSTPMTCAAAPMNGRSRAARVPGVWLGSLFRTWPANSAVRWTDRRRNHYSDSSFSAFFGLRAPVPFLRLRVPLVTLDFAAAGFSAGAGSVAGSDAASSPIVSDGQSAQG